MTHDELTLTEQIHALNVMGDQIQVIERMALTDNVEIDRRLARIARFAEIMDVGGDNLAVIEDDVTNLVNIAAEQRNTITALTTTLVGVIEAVRTLKQQRDNAMRQLHAAPTADALYADFIERIVASNGVSAADAQRIAYILTASDEELLTYDVVEGMEKLNRFRQAVAAAVNALDVEVY